MRRQFKFATELQQIFELLIEVLETCLIKLCSIFTFLGSLRKTSQGEILTLKNFLPS